MIDAALFDLDGTLLDRETALREFSASQFRKYAAALPDVSEAYFVERLIALDDHGRVWKDRVYQTLVRDLGSRDLSWQELLADYEARIADFCRPFPFARETLEILRSRGLRLAVVTNGLTRIQSRAFAALGLADLFEDVLISEAEGVRKPDPEIFQRALRRLEAAAAQTAMIGDSMEADIAGGRAAGLFTIWKRGSEPAIPPSRVEADAVISCLSELSAILAAARKEGGR